MRLPPPPEQAAEFFRLGLSSARDVRVRSFGIVKTDQLIDYPGKRFHPGGLFSQRIFGCVTSWQCECGKYSSDLDAPIESRAQHGLPYKTVCETCHVLLSRNRERRKRCGHIELAAPILHPWLWGNPKRPVELLLGLTTLELRQMMRGSLYVYLESNLWQKELSLAAVIPDQSHSGTGWGMPGWMAGFPALNKLLQDIELQKLFDRLEKELDAFPSSKFHSPAWKKLTRRLALVKTLIDQNIHPVDFLLTALPVIPAGLRTIRVNQQGVIRVDELTRRYQDILRCNNSIDASAEDAEALVPFRRRMTRLVSRLFELLPGRFPFPLTNRVELPPGSEFNPNSEAAKVRKLPQKRTRAAIEADAAYRYPWEFKHAQTETIPPRWKGKRVDYSAVSYVVPDPSIRPGQCGLPLDPIAWELFAPLVVGNLMRQYSFAQPIAEAFVRCRGEIALTHLELAMGSWPVVLSFANAHPSCRVKAFAPRPVPDKAIHLHPLTMQQLGLQTTGAKAKVFLPLSRQASGEAVDMLSASLSGQPTADHSHSFWPSDEALLGCSLAMQMEKGLLAADLSETIAGKWRVFSSPEEIELAVESGKLQWTTPIVFQLAPFRQVIDDAGDDLAGGPQPQRIFSTAGRVLFNALVQSAAPNFAFMPFFNTKMDRPAFGKLRSWFLRNDLRRELHCLVSQINSWGQHRLTQLGLSLSSSDLNVAESKPHRLEEAWKKVDKIQGLYNRGIISPTERLNQVWDIWISARDQLTQEIANHWTSRPPENALSALFSAPVNPDWNRLPMVRRLVGLTGTIANLSGQLIEIPITSSLQEGLTTSEYFMLLPAQRRDAINEHKRRREMQELVRQLAPVLRDLHVNWHDCRTSQSLAKRPIFASFSGSHVRNLRDLLPGRTGAETLIDPLTDEILLTANELISTEQAVKLEQRGFTTVHVRSPLTCDEVRGVCAACLGRHVEDKKASFTGQAIGSMTLLTLADQISNMTPFSRNFISRSQSENKGEVRATHAGFVSWDKLLVGQDAAGKSIVLSRHGSIEVHDWKSRVVTAVEVPQGARLDAFDKSTVAVGTLLASWDPLAPKIYAPADGVVQLVNLLPGKNIELSQHSNGNSLWRVVDDLGPLHPLLFLLDPMGTKLDYHYLPVNTWLHVRNGEAVTRGTLLAESHLEPTCHASSLFPGLAAIANILRVKEPFRRAVLAECAGRVEVSTLNAQGRCQVLVHELNARGKPTGDVFTHPITPCHRLIVRAGDHVRAGEPLTAGDASFPDLLRLCGLSETSSRLLSQLLYELAMQLPRCEPDERLWELVVSRLFSQVEIVSPGSVKELPGKVVERNWLQKLNERMRESFVITEVGGSAFELGSICPEEAFQETCIRLRAEAAAQPKADRPWLVGFRPLLTGLNFRAWQDTPPLHSGGRISIRSKLVEAALAGYGEEPGSVQEALLTGRLIPYGSGWPKRRR